MWEMIRTGDKNTHITQNNINVMTFSEFVPCFLGCIFGGCIYDNRDLTTLE